MRRSAVRTSRPDDLLEREWEGLRAALVEGGCRDDQLKAMRASFMCGCHAAVSVLARCPDAADAVMRELRRALLDDEAVMRRMGMH